MENNRDNSNPAHYVLIPQLRALEHLAYIYECIAQGYMGEGKTEIDNLASLLENDDCYSFQASKYASDSLKQVVSLYRNNKYREATALLSRVSRGIWREVTNVQTQRPAKDY